MDVEIAPTTSHLRRHGPSDTPEPSPHSTAGQRYPSRVTSEATEPSHFQETGSGTDCFTSGTPGNFSTLAKDNGIALWKRACGWSHIATRSTTNVVTTVFYIEDSIGTPHYSYSSGCFRHPGCGGKDGLSQLLQGLLQSIQDWADRRTSFATTGFRLSQEPADDPQRTSRLPAQYSTPRFRLLRRQSFQRLATLRNSGSNGSERFE